MQFRRVAMTGFGLVGLAQLSYFAAQPDQGLFNGLAAIALFAAAVGCAIPDTTWRSRIAGWSLVAAGAIKILDFGNSVQGFLQGPGFLVVLGFLLVTIGAVMVAIVGWKWDALEKTRQGLGLLRIGAGLSAAGSGLYFIAALSANFLPFLVGAFVATMGWIAVAAVPKPLGRTVSPRVQTPPVATAEKSAGPGP
ncbi:MAG: hypothetical protein ACYDDF_07515 [Thermoplasmatota archaeon]